MNRVIKTIPYNLLTNLPILYTELGVTKLYNLIQDRSPQDNLTSLQYQLLYWHRRLAHIDFKKTQMFYKKRFYFKGNCKLPNTSLFFLHLSKVTEDFNL